MRNGGIKKKGLNGFTLVEVIVVSVVVGVLAIAALLMYRGYIIEAKQGTAENLANAAARFLNTADNLEEDIDNYQDLSEGDDWTIHLPSGGQAVFRCPAGFTITLNKNDNTVQASLENDEIDSKEYKYMVE